MAQHLSLDRRMFLKSAGVASVARVASAGAPEPGAPGSGVVPAGTRFDFDTAYDRFGTDCVKYDQQIRIFGKDSVQIGMGIADMDFRAAPAITSALLDRLQHENWGYLDMPSPRTDMAEAIAAWNKRRYGVDIDPASHRAGRPACTPR